MITVLWGVLLIDTAIAACTSAWLLLEVRKVHASSKHHADTVFCWEEKE